jgi:hypothetical protein
MTVSRRENLLASLLWGGVAAVGEFTMLFLTIIGRIHVTFANQAPVFSVDPRGPISLTKDTALAVVWVLTVAYAAIVAVMTYLGPSRVRPLRTTLIVCFLSAALVAALAEPLWGLALAVSLVALYPLLK